MRTQCAFRRADTCPPLRCLSLLRRRRLPSRSQAAGVASRAWPSASAGIAAMQARIERCLHAPGTEVCAATRLYFLEVVKARAVTALCKNGPDRERELGRLDADVEPINERDRRALQLRMICAKFARSALSHLRQSSMRHAQPMLNRLAPNIVRAEMTGTAARGSFRDAIGRDVWRCLCDRRCVVCALRAACRGAGRGRRTRRDRRRRRPAGATPPAHPRGIRRARQCADCSIRRLSRTASRSSRCACPA